MAFTGIAAAQADGSDPASAATLAPADGGRSALRERVRLGQLHVCVADRLVTEAGEPVLVLRNECDRRISVTICLRETPQSAPGFYTLLIAPSQEARQPLGVPAGSEFSYRFNACRSESCTAPRPEC